MSLPLKPNRLMFQSCPRCSKLLTPPVVMVMVPPDMTTAFNVKWMCQDCYMAVSFTETERKTMSATDARAEPEFHRIRPYGVPFIGRDGVLSVRIKGPERPMVVLYDHPTIVEAQNVEYDRWCPECTQWDRPGMEWEPGVWPREYKWCQSCRSSVLRGTPPTSSRPIGQTSSGSINRSKSSWCGALNRYMPKRVLDG